MRVPVRLLTLVWCLAVVPAFALTGRVVDTDGNPVGGAEVSILGRAGSVMTDANGRFAWTPDPPLPFEILVVAPGGVFMKPQLVEALPPGEDPLVVTVQALVSERVMVSGAAPDIEATPAAATTSLSQAEIQTRLPGNLVQALENVAGVNQVSEGQAAVPALRGLSSGRTLILIDGARVNSERRAGSSATFLDPEILEGVEVARGPGSVAYGSDAFGGVIAATTRKVSPSAPLGVRLSASAGTGVPERRAGGDVSMGTGRGSVLVAGHIRNVEDWESPSGKTLNSGYEDGGVLARVTHVVGAGFLSAGYQGDFGRNIERPRNNSSTVRFFYPKEDSHRFTAEYDRPDVGPFDEIGLHGFYGRYGQVTDQNRFATASTARSVERADISAHDFQFRGYARRPIGPARWELGVDVNGRGGLRALDIIEQYNLDGTLQRTTENVSIDAARRVDSAVYTSLEAAVLPNLSLAGGVRGDVVASKNSGGFFGDRSVTKGAGSGFASVTAGSFRGFTFTAQVARGFRDPVLSDRYFRGPSGRGFITGNPDLDSEQSLQFDAGVRYTARRVRAAIFGYEYRISDLIERYQTTTDNFFFRNRGRARLRGVEVETQVELPWRLTVEAAFQAARGRARDPEAYLDGITTETGSIQARRLIGARAFAQARVAWFAEDDRPGPTERVVNGYTLIDASGGATIVRQLELRVLVRNLFDEEYFASQDVRAVFAPGRAASVTAVVRF